MGLLGFRSNRKYTRHSRCAPERVGTTSFERVGLIDVIFSVQSIEWSYLHSSLLSMQDNL
jgi:hypothetical protein